MDCKSARLAIGGDPAHLPPEVMQHLSGCPDCTRFRDETVAMEHRLKAALELPLHRFRKNGSGAKVPRRFALAASVMFALLGAAWMFWPPAALAREVVTHVRHEAGSWRQLKPLSPVEIAAVLAEAGVRYESRLPVLYASPCAFRGRIVPHLVVQTATGPVTIMVLEHEKTTQRSSFSEGGYHGILLPAGAGSIAVIAPDGQDFAAYLDEVLAGVS